MRRRRTVKASRVCGKISSAMSVATAARPSFAPGTGSGREEEQDEGERREQCNACTAVKIYHIILLQSRAYAGDRR